MNREDFPLLNNDIIYLDNSATSLKPKSVIEAISDYYNNYSANAHRGDYDLSFKVNIFFIYFKIKSSKFLFSSKVSFTFMRFTSP